MLMMRTFTENILSVYYRNKVDTCSQGREGDEGFVGLDRVKSLRSSFNIELIFSSQPFYFLC